MSLLTFGAPKKAARESCLSLLFVGDVTEAVKEEVAFLLTFISGQDDLQYKNERTDLNIKRGGNRGQGG